MFIRDSSGILSTTLLQCTACLSARAHVCKRVEGGGGEGMGLTNKLTLLFT